MTGSSSRHEQTERLSRITTHWSMVLGAHDRSEDEADALRRALLERYSAAAYRYLLGAVRDPDVAEDLCQEFAIRWLRGDFRRADPHRGRFRNYVKKALINLVNQHRRSQQRWPKAFPSESFEPGTSDENPQPEMNFDEYLRDELLQASWTALEGSQPRYHAVLRLRIDCPDLSSREMAEELSRKLGKRLTPDTIRKTLERARARFAELLLDEVASASAAESADELRSELQHLSLLKYCRSALDRRIQTS